MDSYGYWSLVANADLPRGFATISSVFDARVITVAPKREWHFSPILHCDDDAVRLDTAGCLDLVLDPPSFEPPRAGLRLSAQEMVRTPPGTTRDLVLIDANDAVYRSESNASDAIRNVPLRPDAPVHGIRVSRITESELSGRDLRRAAQFDVQIDVAPEVEPGRYFVPLAAESSAVPAATEVVVDVVPAAQSPGR